MKTHRILALCCAVLLAVGLATGALGAQSDEPPTLQALYLQQTVVTPGAELVVSADALDEGGGIEQIVLRFTSDAGQGSLRLALRRNTDASLPHPYSGRLTLPADAAGSYSLESAVITDAAGNPRRYFRDEPESAENEPLPNPLRFTVQADGAPPAAAGIALQLPAAQPGGEIQLTLTPAPSAAGVKSASLTFQNNQNGRRIYLSLGAADRQEDGSFQKALAIPVGEEPGSFSLYKMILRDFTGREQIYSGLGFEDHLPLPFSASFGVEPSAGGASPGAAAGAPVLRSVELTGQRSAPGEQSFCFAVRTGGSQPIEHVTLRFENAAGNTLTKVLRAPEGEALWELSDWFTVETTEPAGLYRLESAVVADRQGNRSAYSADGDLPLPSQPAFTLQGAAGEDSTPPVLQSVSLQDTHASRYGTIAVHATAADNQSGVKEVSVQFTSHAGKTLVCKLRGYEDGFTGWLNLERADPGSVWRLTRVIVTDEAGNRQGYYESPRGSGLALPSQPTFSVDES